MDKCLTAAVKTWPEMARKMREDCEGNHWDFLFFKVWIGILAAQDAFDSDREDVLREMLVSFPDQERVWKLIGEL